MDKPLFYIGSAYLWSLMFLALTGKGMAIFLSALACAVLLGELVIRVQHNVRGEHWSGGIVSPVCIAVLVASVLFLLKWNLFYQPAVQLDGTKGEVQGVVTKVMSDSKGGAHRCEVTVLAEKDGLKKGQKVRLSSSKYQPGLNDVVSLKGTLYALGGEDADIQGYYRSINLFLGVYTYQKISVSSLEKAEVPEAYRIWRSFLGKLDSFRTYLVEKIDRFLPKSISGVLIGMLLGDKSDITTEQQEAFRRAGISHLFAVSGFHTSLWSMLLYRLLMRSGLGKRVASVGGMLFTFLFMALTGFPKSGIRAGCMLLLFFLSRLTLRQTDSLNSLGLAVLLIALSNPFCGGDSGIMLSYFATLGILAIFPKLKKKARGKLRNIGNYHLRKRLESVTDVLLISLSTFVFTLPYVMLSFGCVSLVSPITNLLVTTASSLSILLGGLGALFAGIPGLRLLTPWCFLVAGEAIRMINFVCETVSSWSWSYLGISEDYFMVAMSACLILVAAGILLDGLDLKGLEKESGIPRKTALWCGFIMGSSILCHWLIK